MVLFVNVPDIGEPDPLAAMPVRFTALSLVHVNAVPATLFGLLITIFVIAVPEHFVWFVFVALIVGIGLTVTVTVVVVEQLPAVAVIVNVVVTGAFVLFVNVPDIAEPLPLLAIPERPPGVVLVQLRLVPATLFGLVMSIWVIGLPEQTVCVPGVAFNDGVGFIIIVAVVVPEQPPADAAIVNIVVC